MRCGECPLWMWLLRKKSGREVIGLCRAEISNRYLSEDYECDKTLDELNDLLQRTLCVIAKRKGQVRSPDLEEVYVITVSDKDGYDVPIVASPDPELAQDFFEQWALTADKEYWDLDYCSGSWVPVVRSADDIDSAIGGGSQDT